MSAGSTPSMSSQSWHYARSNEQPVKFLSWTTHHRSEQDPALDATAWQDGYMLDWREARCERQRHLGKALVKRIQYVVSTVARLSGGRSRLSLGTPSAWQCA